MSVTIVYFGSSGKTTTDVPTNKQATLPCAGKLMTGNINLTFDDYGGYVQYNGVQTKIAANTLASLPCKGKVAKTDIIVLSSSISPASEDGEVEAVSEQSVETIATEDEISEQSLEVINAENEVLEQSVEEDIDTESEENGNETI